MFQQTPGQKGLPKDVFEQSSFPQNSQLKIEKEMEENERIACSVKLLLACKLGRFLFPADEI